MRSEVSDRRMDLEEGRIIELKIMELRNNGSLGGGFRRAEGCLIYRCTICVKVCLVGEMS